MLNRALLVAECGEYGAQLRYRENGQPECSFTCVVRELGKDGATWFKTYVPVVLYGAAAEKAAAELEPGTLVAVDGKLAWRTQGKKAEGKAEGKLVIMASHVEVIQPAAVASAN
jgi:single-stranded DNA-binding protein